MSTHYVFVCRDGSAVCGNPVLSVSVINRESRHYNWRDSFVGSRYLVFASAV